MIRRYLPKSTEELLRWYERYISPASLLVGFAIDATAAQVLDISVYSFVLLFHLSLAALGVLVLQLIETGRLRQRSLIAAAPFIPVIIQFAFGGLFSGFIILYSKSASFAVSWVFVVILAALLIGNERFRRIYVTFPVQVGILFFALFSFTIFYIPVALGVVGTWLFLVSGAVSVGIIAGFISLCSILMRQRVMETLTTTARIVAGIFVLINALYFVNAIPPLPLALKDAGIFHSVIRTGDSYMVEYEPTLWYEVYLRYNTLFHRTEDEPVYVFTAVFAPSGISTGLVHEWQYFNEALGDWVTKDRVSFPITGGRAGGYRGYTIRRGLEEGFWRVNVLTDYRRLIGRVRFKVVNVTEEPLLLEGVR